ncbi:MAG: NCS2 family permease, partial [Rickettsiales bacterium]
MDYFRLKARGTSLRREIVGGFTTFLTMLYILPVNALIMSQAGMPQAALLTATGLMTALACLISGLWANVPIAMSVGMGLNAFFTFSMVQGMGLPWQTALGIVFLSGVLFFILSITPFRRWILESIPADLRCAVSAGIGAFIAFIGLKELGFIVASPATLVHLGDLSSPNALLGLLGLLLAAIFWLRGVKAAFLLSVLATAVVGWGLGIAPMPQAIVSLPASPMPILMQLDVVSALQLSLVPVIVIYMVTHLMDSLGTISAIGMRAGLFGREKADHRSLQKAIEADAFASVLSGPMGVSTTTSFIESASGVEAGGRTGLTAVVTGVCFMVALLFFPIFAAIPAAA